jgi:hypothetical protein
VLTGMLADLAGVDYSIIRGVGVSDALWRIGLYSFLLVFSLSLSL